MWADLLARLGRFPDAVLTGVDAAGHPVSVRCRPEPDEAGHVLRGVLAAGIEISDGPASVLCHSHDAKLWSLRSFLARGTVQTTGTEWVFTPRSVVPGTGMDGPFADLRSFVAARRRAGRYLTRRGIPRPRVPWSEVRRLP